MENTYTPWWMEDYETVQFAQDGAKLENIEVAEEPSVIPEGALHKNKNNLDLDITKKGIPVVTVANDNVESFEEIKAQEKTLVQHAEIEHNEVIFSKELTDFLEQKRQEYHDDPSKAREIFLETGMRLTKELLENTNDNTGLIDKLNN